MQKPKSRWDVERAAAWLRRHAWGAGGEEAAPALVEAALQVPPAQQQLEAPQHERDEDGGEEIDIAGWPALVAPFYD